MRIPSVSLSLVRTAKKLKRTGVNETTSRSVRFLRPRFPKLRDDRGPQACREDGGQGYECHPDPMNCRHVDLHADRRDCGRVGGHGSGRPWSVQIRTEFDWVVDTRRLCRVPWSRQVYRISHTVAREAACANRGNCRFGKQKVSLSEWPPTSKVPPMNARNYKSDSIVREVCSVVPKL